MNYGKKIILLSKSGYRPEMDALIEQFISDGVKFVGVVGEDCAKLEDIIDELVVGDGNRNYFMLTTSHPGETLEEAVEFACCLTDEFSGEVQIVEF